MMCISILMKKISISTTVRLEWRMVVTIARLVLMSKTFLEKEIKENAEVL